MELGEKIKKRRRELGLTQEMLAGDQITRNMLCQIEKGKAVPSLPTLSYLAERLRMPVGYFFCREEDEFFYRKQKIFPHLLSLYKAGSYAECLRTFEKELGECDDELGLMMAVCSFDCGRRAWRNGAFESALAYHSNTLDYINETTYPTDYLKAGCALYMAISANVQAPLLEFNELGYIDCLREAGCLDVYCYLTEKQDYVYENSIYAEHLRAKELMKRDHYTDALVILEEIEKQKGSDQITAFLLFRVYADMEICYRENGNYEGAYRYSTKRLSLLNAFKS